MTMRRLKQGASALLLLLTCTAGAYACSCADPSAREKFRAAHAVFSGKIMEVKPNTEMTGAFHYFPEVVRFKVEKQWKGSRKAEMVVMAAYDSPGMCGDLELIVGESYLIYAHRKQGKLIIHRDCGPNSLLKHADNELKVLHRL